MYNKLKNNNAPVHFANLLEGFLNNDFNYSERKASFVPSVNIRENDEQYEIHLQAPGLNKDEFTIDVDKNVLTVAFEHKEESNESNDKWLRQEFKAQSFKRSFNLNEKIDAANIQATYQNGILQVNLPKKEKEELKTVKISVQ